ncbi:response regulator transcription factor [Paraburkholderia polaris]|uniref:response regulator transcription factor n=1 Tax=Paraburkholderia polaris TaxID=2728848 RepID=UPI002E35B685|nr:LuxR C-terminal-related transcriptional regulator [Paraburkholderia polaris]
MDFLPKPVRDTDLLRAIGQALEHTVQPHAIWSELDEIRQRLGRLTPRERQVMVLVVIGRLNKQVTAELGTVEKTTKAHRARDGEDGSHVAGRASPHRRQGRSQWCCRNTRIALLSGNRARTIVRAGARFAFRCTHGTKVQ